MNKLSLYIIVVILSIGRLYPESTFSQNNIANAINEFLNENLDKNCKYEILGNIESVKYNLPDVTASISSRNDKFEGLINLQITFKSNER